MTLETSLVSFSVLATITLLFFDKNKTKLAIITILIILGSILGVFYVDSSPSEYNGLFREELNRAGMERGGQPVEGFTAFMYLDSFPGILEEDFDGVESYEGIYKIDEGELSYTRLQDHPVTSAEDVISNEGYSTLLNNISKRLNIEVKSESDIAVLLEKIREADTNQSSYITDGFSVWHPDGWYAYENGSSVFFTHDENLTVPPNTDGFALGSYFQVSVETLDNESGETMTEGQYFAQNLWVEGSEFLVSKNKAIINGLNLTRVVTAAAGAGGEVLHYVFYDEPTRIITLSQYPYDENSPDSEEFEEVVKKFQPNFIGDAPDRSAIVPHDTGVNGRVLLGPTCPVQRTPPDPNCADRGFETTIQVRHPDPTRSSLVTSVESEEEGSYSIALPPGEYRLQALGGNPFPNCDGKDIVVERRIMLEVDLYCDTGIR